MSRIDTKKFNELSPKEYKKQTQIHWTSAPCGVSYSDKEFMSKHYFEEVEKHRYGTHPWILENIKKFDLENKKVLEIGLGMGTDHLSMARQGGIMYGIELTPQNLIISKKRLEMYGFNSELLIGDAEYLPYPDNSFDFIYSFGVIHHSPDTQKIISEIYRVLKPGGQCWITVYHKTSLFFWWTIFLWKYLIMCGWKKYTLKQQLSLIEYPNNNPNMVIRLYKKHEFADMFHSFSSVASYIEHLLVSDITVLSSLFKNPERPRKIFDWLGTRFGWYIVVKAQK